MWEHKPTKWTKSNYHVPGPVSHIGSWTHTAKVIVSGYETLQRRHPLVTLPQYRIYRDKIGYLDWLDSANVHQEGRWVLAQSNPLESGCPHLASDSWWWHFEAATRLQKESTCVAADKSLSMQRGAKKLNLWMVWGLVAIATTKQFGWDYINIKPRRALDRTAKSLCSAMHVSLSIHRGTAAGTLVAPINILVLRNPRWLI